MNTTKTKRSSTRTTTSRGAGREIIAQITAHEDLKRLLAIMQATMDQLIAEGRCPDTHGDQCEDD